MSLHVSISVYGEYIYGSIQFRPFEVMALRDQVSIQEEPHGIRGALVDSCASKSIERVHSYLGPATPIPGLAASRVTMLIEAITVYSHNCL